MRPSTHFETAIHAATGAGKWRLAVLAAAPFVSILVLLDLSGGAPAAQAAPTVYVFPIPGGRVASPGTQITFRGVPAGQLGSIQVSGSQSGNHPGLVLADSDGNGGSFIPNSAFRPGEGVTVTARGLNIEGTGNTSYTFTVARPAPGFSPRPAPSARRVPGDVWRYRSYPSIAPPAVKVLKRSNRTAQGKIFLAPWRGPVQDGPEILDKKGHLVWFKAVPSPNWISDVRVQSYQGKPVLTWWQGELTSGALTAGQGVINDTSYTQIATVDAGNGLSADVHEFEISPANTALMTADNPLYWDARSVHGSSRQVVIDSVVQEIDIPTGLVLFQWDSLDHVPLGDTYNAVPQSASKVFDYFHVNSIDPDRDGNLIVSGHQTFAAYKIDHQTAATIWTLGGKHSSFKMGPGAKFAFQHDIRVRASHDLYFTMFDDGAGQFKAPGHSQSRGLKLKLDFTHMTARTVTQYLHSPALRATFGGNVQQLSNFDEFVGWGEPPYFSEYDSGGRLLFDARFVGNNTSYRAYRFAWAGTPHTLPRVATRNVGSSTVVWMTWNGATNVASWRVLEGPNPKSLHSVGSRRKTRYETVITIPAQTYIAAQALDREGKVLSTSQAVHT